MSQTVPLAKPFLDKLEEEAVIETLRSGWISQGPKSAEFEKALADHLGLSHVRTVNSGSSAIQLALMALGVQPGDEVVVPGFTCIAAIHPIVALGAVPVPVDIDLANYGLAAEFLAARLTDRSKVVMVAHLFGLAADVDSVISLTRPRSLSVLEDTALGLGSLTNGRPLGTFGDVSIFSFHPRKMITTGEGGAVATRDTAIADRVSSLRNYGASVNAWSRHTTGVDALPEYGDAGFNFKLTDLQATIGIQQLRKLPEMIRLRQDVAQRYDSAFSSLTWLETTKPRDGDFNGYQSYVIRCGDASDPLDRRHGIRKRLVAHLAQNGIGAVQAAQVVTDFATYRDRYGWRPEQLPHSLLADRTSLALPIFPGLGRGQQDQVISAIETFRA